MPTLNESNMINPVNPDVKTLYGLHLAHMLAVPFENLDIGIKRKIHITEQGIIREGRYQQPRRILL